MALAGAAHGTAVAARVQRLGRGRSGRPWVSPPGNLHVTVVLRPDGDARQAPQLAFVTALAVAEAVDTLLAGRCALKWPNDVLRGGAKLAGILMERLDDGAVLAGIGVNVVHSPPAMPYPVTSLSALGCTVDADGVLAPVLACLAAGWQAWQADGFAPVLARWSARGPAPGAPLRMRFGDTLVAGRFAGLGPDGSLLLDGPEGRRAFVAGEVVL